MSIVIDLDPNLEATIRDHAASVDMDMRQYVSRWVSLLAINPRLGEILGDWHDTAKREEAIARAAKVAKMRRDIHEFSINHKIPPFPDESLTRESIYRDHD